MRRMANTSRLLTMQEAADQIGVSLKTVYNWIQAGKLEHFKLGHTVRIPPEAISVHYRRQADVKEAR